VTPLFPRLWIRSLPRIPPLLTAHLLQLRAYAAQDEDPLARASYCVPRRAGRAGGADQEEDEHRHAPRRDWAGQRDAADCAQMGLRACGAAECTV
jgi:hypothetical protein